MKKTQTLCLQNRLYGHEIPESSLSHSCSRLIRHDCKVEAYVMDSPHIADSSELYLTASGQDKSTKRK